jgi:hypothetical protein
MTFTADDEGTDVIDSDGRQLGVVEEVVNGTAFVAPAEGLDGWIRAELGWGGDDRDTYRLDAARVKYHSSGEIRLRDP